MQSFSLSVRVQQLKNSSASHSYVTAVKLNLLLKVQTYITCQAIRDARLQFKNRMQKCFKAIYSGGVVTGCFMFSLICHAKPKELGESIFISGHTFIFSVAFNMNLNVF